MRKPQRAPSSPFLMPLHMCGRTASISLGWPNSPRIPTLLGPPRLAVSHRLPSAQTVDPAASLRTNFKPACSRRCTSSFAPQAVSSRASRPGWRSSPSAAPNCWRQRQTWSSDSHAPFNRKPRSLPASRSWRRQPRAVSRPHLKQRHWTARRCWRRRSVGPS